MENPFAEAMARLPEKKLIRIITTERELRDPLALQAAEAELSKRGVDEFKIRRTAASLRAKVVAGQEIETSKLPPWLRLSHHLIDQVCFFVLLYAVILLTLWLELTEDEFLLQLMHFAALFGCFFGYFVFTEWKFHQTLGMMVTNCQVKLKNGQFADFDTIVKRTFCRLIPFEAIFYLISGSMLHDKLSGTVVVRRQFVVEEGIDKSFIPDLDG